jgi:Ca-activated chloride channel family protein
MAVRALVVAVAFGWAWHAAGDSFTGMWLTPDQHGALLLRRGRAAEAANAFRDPVWRGVALYRATAFEDAASVLGAARGAVAAYDAGNALLMAGRYDDAIASYDRALSVRPGWPEARTNRELAAARRDARAAAPEGDGGTGGKVAPDDVVTDDRARNASDRENAPTESGDADLQSIWLRNVQTKPADFLRAKFAYQASRRTETPQ